MTAATVEPPCYAGITVTLVIDGEADLLITVWVE